jgi:hypothetical protein
MTTHGAVMEFLDELTTRPEYDSWTRRAAKTPKRL